MIIALLGKSGAGKTTIAKAMEKYVKNSFVIDGDELRAEMKNYNVKAAGRRRNQILGYERARRLSDLGFTVFLSMQAPNKKIRNKFLNKYDVKILVQNDGPNPKDKMGYNDHFNPDYSDVVHKQILQDFTPKDFYDKFFPRVLVPSRFQGFHKGHMVILEEAKRISPNVTIALRVDDGDIIDLNENIKLLQSKGYKVIKTPNINENWTDFANNYDIYVQGNPDVIKKFAYSNCKLHYVPRYGNVSGTNIRNAIKNHENVLHDIDKETEKLIRKSITWS